MPPPCCLFSAFLDCIDWVKVNPQRHCSNSALSVLQAGTTFVLESADGGIGVLGSDARVWIKNTGGGLLQRVLRHVLI